MGRLTRRHCMSLLAKAFLAIPAMSLGQLSGASRANAETDPELSDDIERWMNAWMGGSKVPGGTLHLSRFKDPIYFLLQPISWKPNPGQDLGDVHVPKGFVTDFASVPRLFWTLLRPDGDYTYPAIIHDFLYWTQDRPKDEADTVFRAAMQDFDIDGPTTATLYNTVHLAGQRAWDQNATAKARGEKRILKRYPQDPRITWAEWKIRPDVFESS